jgi:hypothetical protein
VMGCLIMATGLVEILDESTMEVVDYCYGPEGGICSRLGADGVVGCSGHRIEPEDASPEYSRLWVPPGTRQCPLAWNLEVMGY